MRPRIASLPGLAARVLLVAAFVAALAVASGPDAAAPSGDAAPRTLKPAPAGVQPLREVAALPAFRGRARPPARSRPAARRPATPRPRAAAVPVAPTAVPEPTATSVPPSAPTAAPTPPAVSRPQRVKPAPAAGFESSGDFDSSD